MAEDGSRSSKSFVQDLKLDWSLFWHSIVGDEETDSENSTKEIDPFVTGKIAALSLEKICAIMKALSQDRRRLNQRLEALNKELDLNVAKLESLRLVGGETIATENRINELSDLGQKLSLELNNVNNRIKQARQRERALISESREFTE